MKLNELKPGKMAIIKSVNGERLLRRRLLEMGLTPNTKVLCQKVAPMKDPIELYVRSYVLTLRKADAQMIEIEEIQ